VEKVRPSPLRYPAFTYVILTCCLTIFFSSTSGQVESFDGKPFQSYKKRVFRPERKLQYNLYLSPVITVDPLGIGGKSTYAIGTGSRINLWESKIIDNNLQGLRIKGLYVGFGYDYYPQQADDLYTSLWLRVKTFMPITARLDLVYSFGDELHGLSSRYCVGFEVRKIALLLTGSIHNFISPVFGDHPHLDSPYSNVGSVMMVIPVFNHFPETK
jgi:hypothetical protein